MKFECAHDDLIEIHKLQPNPRNPNKHPDKQIEMLAKIIDYQGQRSPIVVSKRSGFVTKGHGRLAALQKLGWQKAAVDFQEYESEAQEHADMIADNKIAELAQSDELMINELALELPKDFDFELLGIEDFNPVETNVLNEELEDEAPDVPKDTIIKPGDIIELGDHRLMCGDSTVITNVEKLMNGERADMVFTDPPYGMQLDPTYSNMRGWGDLHKTGGRNYENVIGDHGDFNPEFINTVFAVFSYVKEIFLWGADYYAQLIPDRNDGSWVVWDKRLNENQDEGFGSCFELCWSKQKHKRYLARILYAGIFGFSEDTKTRVHPTQKPVKLSEWFFEKWGSPEDKVVDLFGGSGSTLIACEKTNRKCFMMELDPHYCDVIVTRWCKYTNKNKIKLNGKTVDWKIDV